MRLDPLLQRLASDLHPEVAAKRRIRRRLEQRIGQMVPAASEWQRAVALTPRSGAKDAIWARIVSRIQPASVTVLERVRTFLIPSQALQRHLKQRILVHPITAQIDWSGRLLKWGAAVAAFALLVRAAPVLLIPSPTIAESAVTLVATRGEVSVALAGEWEPITGELVLEPGMTLRTTNGEASVLFHDDGVIRLGVDTTVTLHDTSDRLEPAPELLPTFTLHTGTVWLQGLVPSHVRGLTVSTAYGHITVHEGSISIAQRDDVSVDVYDRSASVMQGSDELVLVSGERTDLRAEAPLLVKKLPIGSYQTAWVAQNLGRDAVHRREIAQLQQERRAAMAGILPNSTLYPVKRAAEAVDVLLTFDEDSRVQKRIAQANNRLNEAAALLAQDQQDDAALSLQEYRDILLALSQDSVDGALVQFLLQQSLVETSAAVAAALPNDAGYQLKQTVLETSAAVDGLTASVDDIRGVLLIDTLTALTNAVEEGERDGVYEAWVDLQPHLAIITDEAATLQPAVYREVVAMIDRFHDVVTENPELVAEEPELVQQVAAFLPPQTPVVVLMTDEEVLAIVQGIRARVFLYSMTQSRINQFLAELKAIDGNQEEGRILRRLYLALPDGPERFPDRVRHEITDLRWQKAGEVL